MQTKSFWHTLSLGKQEQVDEHTKNDFVYWQLVNFSNKIFWQSLFLVKQKQVASGTLFGNLSYKQSAKKFTIC